MCPERLRGTVIKLVKLQELLFSPTNLHDIIPKSWCLNGEFDTLQKQEITNRAKQEKPHRKEQKREERKRKSAQCI